MTYTVEVQEEAWPLREAFRISRGAKTEARVVTVSISQENIQGRGEATPYARYGETPKTVIQQIESIRPAIEKGLSVGELTALLPAGAARNAVDCALWDLCAKQTGVSVVKTLGLQEPALTVTAVTLSLGTPAEMGAKAKALSGCPLLKVKLGNTHILDSIRAIRENAPQATIIIDPNESWSLGILKSVDRDLAEMGVAMLEQPLPAGDDDCLLNYDNIVPICADEACHTSADLERLKGRYQLINIKLDKTGGLSGALELLAAAKKYEFGIMIGCMVATSLAMAPALILASDADFVDLDGPLWMADDREYPLEIQQGIIKGLQPKLWGGVSS